MKRTIEDWALFGGPRLFDTIRTTMNLFPPDGGIFFRHAKRSFDAMRLTNNGPALLELEMKLASLHGVRRCVAFSSGFTAMYVAIRNLGLPGRKEVITPSLTYRKMADIIEWGGFVPRFCDVDRDTLGPSRETVEACINGDTAMILAAHPRTRLCDVDGIAGLSRETGIPLMFDSVEACGATHKGRPLGGFGDCESFSMHADKIINGAEGGYITTDNEDFAAKISLARAFGLNGPDRIELPGTNAKLNELHAALALSGIAHHEEQLRKNMELHLSYQESLRGIPGFNVVDYDRDEKRNWRSLLVRLDETWPLSRRQTLDLLNAENVLARPYYFPPQHITYGKARQTGENRLPVTEWAAECHLILPFGSTVSMEDTKIIGQAVRSMGEQGLELRKRLERHEEVN